MFTWNRLTFVWKTVTIRFGMDSNARELLIFEYLL